MLLYDVTYWRDGKRQVDLDTGVTYQYLCLIATDLSDGETAYARCINGARSEDREIDKAGVRPMYIR